ncbi:conserved hypothetical protein [delta proteobacterium NaphS2]|nr:conserved hypothetical protein [delta proteobacterium NaphS2]
MQTLKSKKVMLLLIGLVAIFVFGVTTSLAQEKIKLQGKRFGTYTSDSIKVEDMENHILGTGMAKGVDVIQGSIFFTWSTADLVNGNGTHQGYTKTIDKDGDATFGKWQGEVSTTMSPKGTPLVMFEGTWSFTKGTGKWKNVQGNGTYKGKFIGPGIYSYDLEGEYFIKK